MRSQQRTLTLFVLLVAGAASCDSRPREDRRYLDEITGGTSAVRTARSLCELVRRSDSVGVYTVDEMYSQVEAVPASASGEKLVTYIELVQVERWAGTSAPKLTIRTSGGAGWMEVNGRMMDITATTAVSLKKGEQIVYFEQRTVESDQAGYPDINSHTTFRDVGGGYASAVMFVNNPVSLVDFEDLVTQIASVAADQACPVDICPDSGCPPTTSVATDTEADAGEPDAGSL